MHKTLWLFSVLSALVLAGCASQTVAPAQVDEAPSVVEMPVQETVTNQTLTQAMTTQTAPEPQAPTFLLETVTHSDSLYAPDDETVLLARYDYYLPYLTVEGDSDDQSLAIADNFNAQFAKWEEASGFAEMAQLAQDDYAYSLDDQNAWFGHYQNELSTTTYQTTGYISVSGVYYSFTGGAHPNTVLMSWLFDLATGTFLSPLSLANDPQAFSNAVAEALTEQIQTTDIDGFTLEEFYWDDYQSVIAGWDSYCVYFSDTGMHIEFSPYELAAYVVGPQTFVLDYATITPYLSDQALILLDLV